MTKAKIKASDYLTAVFLTVIQLLTQLADELTAADVSTST